MTSLPQTEIEKKRAAWWAENFKPGMTTADVFQLNEQIISLFPATNEERARKTKDWEGVPGFVL
jgi:hypothetical protein